MDVVILGRIGYDLYSEEPHVPLPQVRRFSRYLGGSSANMAVGLSRLGARVGIVSCLGEDSLSQFLIDFLKSENVDTAHVQTRAGFLPSLCLTEVSPPDRFPQVFYRHDAVDTMLSTTTERHRLRRGLRGCSSPTAHRCAPRPLAKPPTARSNAPTRQVAGSSSTSTSAPCPGPAPRKPVSPFASLLPFVDVLIGNQPELMLVAGAAHLDQATEKLRTAGVPILVSKLGEQGTRVWTGDESVFLPPYKVEVCTTIGAGDGFASGFLYALLQGMPVEECLHYGNAAAAIVVSRLSCSEAMPTLDEVKELIRAQRR